VFALEGGDAPPFVVWSPRRADDAEPVAEAREEKRRAARAEHRRLLYVAMTRAAERLIVAGYHGVRGKAEDCWYDMIEQGLNDRLTKGPAPWSRSEEVRRVGAGVRAEPGTTTVEAAYDLAPPAWLFSPAPKGCPPLMLAAASRERRDDEAYEHSARREAGRLSHALLEYLPDLPRARRSEAGLRFLDSRAKTVDTAERAAILHRIIAVLDEPSLAPLFEAGSRAEAPIEAEFPGPSGLAVRFAGRIDRVVISERQAMIADFKSGAPPRGEAPPDHVAQLALYRAALQLLYPGRAIRAFLVWLEGPRLIEIDGKALDAAFAERLSGSELK
jgi:ATP-dependent helicase/nuclease subunit A